MENHDMGAGSQRCRPKRGYLYGAHEICNGNRHPIWRQMAMRQCIAEPNRSHVSTDPTNPVELVLRREWINAWHEDQVANLPAVCGLLELNFARAFIKLSCRGPKRGFSGTMHLN